MMQIFAITLLSASVRLLDVIAEGYGLSGPRIGDLVVGVQQFGVNSAE